MTPDELVEVVTHSRQQPVIEYDQGVIPTAPLLAAIRDANLRIPEDVSFLTYGDSRWSAAYRPPISVIRYDYYGEGLTLTARVLRCLGEAVDVSLADRPLAVDEFTDRGSIALPHA